ncbi:hypothetical protein O3M35_010610 [Rhynocoris fuscipes]|uniref:Glycolipid transfer protein domain-containing protein n=1 Tax=Rhynocoris fuscipes TaxID=488301 RepID=A0AAW1D0X5_9HEMI
MALEKYTGFDINDYVSEDNYFSKLTMLFIGSLEDHGDYILVNFIDCMRTTLSLIDNFGISLTSIRYEMESYIQVLEKHEDVFSNFNIHHLLRGIVHEIEIGGYEFTEAVMWISRYIDFIRAVIQNLLLEGFENNQLDETTENVLRKSYDETLAQYRDWTAQKTFKALIVKSPRKKSLIKKFMNSKPTRKELLIIAMEGCVEVMSEIVAGLKATFEEANLEKDIEQLKLQHLFTFQRIEEAN